MYIGSLGLFAIVADADGTHAVDDRRRARRDGS